MKQRKRLASVLVEIIPTDPTTELLLKEGEILEILEDFKDGWMKARKMTATGEVGLVPEAALDFLSK